MTEKPTYEELAQRIKELEQEKLENNTIKDDIIHGKEWPVQKTESKISPKIQVPEIALDSIINSEEIQSIMDDFYYLTHLATAILDLEGRVIEATGWQDICTKFHRVNPETAHNCTQSDLFLAKNLKPGEYIEYKCKNGLWDVVTPLYVGSKHLGNIYAGQFFYDDEQIDEDFFIKQAEIYGFDKDSYLDAFRHIPRYNRGTVNHLMGFLVQFATYISRVSFTNIQLEKEIYEHKQADEALRESETRLRTLIRTIPDLVWLKDQQGIYLSCNARFESLFGSKEKDIIGKTDYDFVDKELADFFRKHDKKAMDKGKPSRNEEEVTFADDGHREILETIKTPMYRSDGQLAGVLGIGRDITERKLAEEALRESEERFRGLVESSSDWIWEINAEGVYTYSSPKIEKILGYTPEEVVGKTLFDLMLPEEAERIVGIFQDLVRRGGPIVALENVNLHKDGRRMVLETNGVPIFDPAGNVSGYRGMDRDITDTQRAEEALRESEESLRAILAASPGPMVMYNSDGEPLYINPAFTDVFLWSLDELKGRHIPFVPEDQKEITIEEIRKIYRSEATSIFETQRYTKDGRMLDVIVSAAVFKGPDGMPAGMVVNLTDISERKSLQAQYEQTKKIESIGRLAGGVAHDLNNLLSPILGYSEMLMNDLDTDDTRRKSVGEILRAGFRARDLVRQLLAFSRKQTLEYKPVNMNKAVSGFEKLLRHTIREDIEIETILSLHIRTVMADIGQIEQVIMNLAVNAGDAMPDGGHLTIEIAPADLDEEYAKTHQAVEPGAYVMMAVSDTGFGMDEETREHIFEPFFSTKGERGTGLGLATVYGIVKQHGGNIWVCSESGKGTTFKVYLPVSKETHVEERASKGTFTGLKGSETILLVEDNEHVRNIGQIILKQQGYSVLVAENGTEALSIVETHADPVHLLLTDVVMPEMNGRELFNRAAEKRPSLKVLYMSGYTDNVIAHRGVLDEGVQFIQKPFTVQGLSTKVREVLEQD